MEVNDEAAVVAADAAGDDSGKRHDHSRHCTAGRRKAMRVERAGIAVHLVSSAIEMS